MSPDGITSAQNKLFTAENVAKAGNCLYTTYTLVKLGPKKGALEAAAYLKPHYEKLKPTDEKIHFCMLAALALIMAWCGGLWNEGGFIATGALATKIYSDEICAALKDPEIREKFLKLWNETKSLPLGTCAVGAFLGMVFPMQLAGLAYGSYLAFPTIQEQKKEEPKGWISNPLTWQWRGKPEDKKL